MLRPDRPLRLAAATVDDDRELARRYLPRQLFDYIDGGAYRETTMRANTTELASIRLRQRVLQDVSSINLRTTVLGEDVSLPVILAPVGLGGMFARRAETQAARAAAEARTVFCESTVSICSIEEVRRASAGPLWFQLYVMRDRSFAEGLMARAAAVGVETLVLTVDLAVVGARYRDTRNGLAGEQLGELGAIGKALRGIDLVSHPRWLRDVAIGGKPHTFGNLEDAVPGARTPDAFRTWVDAQFDPSVTWDDLAWVREHWGGRLVLKGILDPDDARRAVDHGVEGIVVSNHGGRQLDDTPATIRALPDVVAAVGGQAEVLVDGGIRTGLDVVKAVALGARACLVGRPWAYAVAAGGQAGVARMLRRFRSEMLVAMALTASTDVRDLDPSILLDPPTPT